MQPVVHIAVGYLCYAAFTRWRYGRPPRDTAVIVAVVAAGLPDLIDQPLAAVGITPVGRTVAHSLLFALPLVAVVWLVAARRDQRVLGAAFAVGYLSHLAADVPWHVLSGDYHELGFLLWPVTEMPAYSGVKTVGTLAGVEVTTLWFEAVIFGLGALLWYRDGMPGLGWGRRAYHERR